MNKWVKLAVIAGVVILVLRFRNQIAGAISGLPVLGKLIG
jgi:hypothetical protein